MALPFALFAMFPAWLRWMKTVGDKWAAFQAENFKAVSQPLYVILTPDEKLVNRPIGYTPSESEYPE